MEDPLVTIIAEQRMAEQRVRGQHPNWEVLLRAVAAEKLEKIVAQHRAHRHILGIQQGRELYQRDLEDIYRYYLDAANQGNPVAMYHIIYFLVHFGDILGLNEQEILRELEGWRERALTSDLTRDRIVELSRRLAREEADRERREEEAARRIETLVRLAQDRMDMIDNIVIQQAKRIQRLNELQRERIEEMERERERMIPIRVEIIRQSAMLEARQLEIMGGIFLEGMRQRRW